jgi:hypothetical protein
VRPALVILVLTAGLAACGGDDNPQQAATAPAAQTPAATQTAVATQTAAATQTAPPPTATAATSTPERTATPKATAASTPEAAPTMEPTPKPKENVILACLKEAQLYRPERRSAGLWAGIYRASGMDVVVNGPYKKKSEATDYAKQLAGVTLAEPAGRYVVSAALTSKADQRVETVADCLKTRT